MNANSRAQHLDILRGLALFGILLVNLTWFTGTAVQSPVERATFVTQALDDAVRFLTHVLIDGKFYGLFSLLFGTGVYLQRRRLVREGLPVKRSLSRRFFVLFLFGALHASLLWFGDILTLYALTAFALLPFLDRTPRTLVTLAVLCFTLPILTALCWLPFPAGREGHGPPELLYVFGTGTFGEALNANLAYLRERFFLAVYRGRFFKLLGYFLLGYAAGRSGMALSPERFRDILKRLRKLGLGIGIPANVSLALLASEIPLRPPSLAYVLLSAVEAIALPTLAIGYAALVIELCMKGNLRRLHLVFALPGRMTFTHYVTQTVIGITFFYGSGLGLFGALPASAVPLLAALVFAAHVVVTRALLQRGLPGPLEWAWRRLSAPREWQRVPSEFRQEP